MLCVMLRVMLLVMLWLMPVGECLLVISVGNNCG
jgi:hypothetical protein